MLLIDCAACDKKDAYDLDTSSMHYCVRQYRYGDKITVWLGDQYGSPKKTRTVNLKIWIFRSPAERIKNIRERYERVADRLNSREMFFNHEVEKSTR